MGDVYASVRTALHPGGDPVANAYVALYTTGGALLQDGNTDADGEVFLGTRAAGSYELRITPLVGTVADGASRDITVVAGDSTFDVVVNTTTMPVATNARFCRCSGYFITSSGLPAARITIEFNEFDIPQLAYYSADATFVGIIPTSVSVKTDDTGYAVIDLVRNATYNITMAGYHDVSRQIKIPDASSAPLPDTIFPVIDRVEYKNGINTLLPVEAPTLAMSVLDELTLSLETVFTSGLRCTGLVDVTLVSSDETKLAASLTDDTVVLQAISAGVAVLEVTASEIPEEKGISIAEAPALRGSITVTVT